MVPPPTAAFLEQLRDPRTGNINPFLRFNKTARGLANLMRNLATNLRNPRVASQLTLGAYGNLIEFTVHNWMHMRWATISRNPESGLPLVRGDYDIDKKWDGAQHDWLGDFHSSHVNPIFWKLHGWVDGCIGVWEAAHDATHPGQVKPQEVRGLPWFATGPWVLKADPFDWPGAGGSHDHGGGHGGHAGHEQQTLEQVMAILKEVSERPDTTARGGDANEAGAPATGVRPLLAPRIRGVGTIGQPFVPVQTIQPYYEGDSRWHEPTRRRQSRREPARFS